MKFSRYLAKNNIIQEEAARALGIAQSTISRYINGVAIPSKKLMQKIIAYTSGEVQPNDFYGVENEENY